MRCSSGRSVAGGAEAGPAGGGGPRGRPSAEASGGAGGNGGDPEVAAQGQMMRLSGPRVQKYRVYTDFRIYMDPTPENRMPYCGACARWSTTEIMSLREHGSYQSAVTDLVLVTLRTYRSAEIL